MVWIRNPCLLSHRAASLVEPLPSDRSAMRDLYKAGPQLKEKVSIPWLTLSPAGLRSNYSFQEPFVVEKVHGGWDWWKHGMTCHFYKWEEAGDMHRARRLHRAKACRAPKPAVARGHYKARRSAADAC